MRQSRAMAMWCHSSEVPMKRVLPSIHQKQNLESLIFELMFHLKCFIQFYCRDGKLDLVSSQVLVDTFRTFHTPKWGLKFVQKLFQCLKFVERQQRLMTYYTVCSDGLWPSIFLTLKIYTFLTVEFIYKSRGILGFVPRNHSQNHLCNFAKLNCIFHF